MHLPAPDRARRARLITRARARAQHAQRSIARRARGEFESNFVVSSRVVTEQKLVLYGKKGKPKESTLTLGVAAMTTRWDCNFRTAPKRGDVSDDGQSKAGE